MSVADYRVHPSGSLIRVIRFSEVDPLYCLIEVEMLQARKLGRVSSACSRPFFGNSGIRGTRRGTDRSGRGETTKSF